MRGEIAMPDGTRTLPPKFEELTEMALLGEACKGCARCRARWGVGRCAAPGCEVQSDKYDECPTRREHAAACAPSSLMRMRVVCSKRQLVECPPPMCRVKSEAADTDFDQK